VRVSERKRQQGKYKRERLGGELLGYMIRLARVQHSIILREEIAEECGLTVAVMRARKTGICS